MDEKELEIMIPSGYVRESGWTFTDKERASLLYHADISWMEQCRLLEGLQLQTGDGELKRQILEYLDKARVEYAAFKENADRSHIYILKVREDGGYWDGEYLTSGYFFDWETAYGYGKKEDAPFEVEKFPVDDMPVSEDGPYSQHAEAGIRFDKDGEAECFWSNEKTGFDNRRFDNAIIKIPNPFQRGDIVKCKGDDGRELFGIVEEEREEWEKRLAQHLQRVREGDSCIDFTDLFTSVAFLRGDGTFAVSDSAMPLELERYEPKEEDWTKGSVDTLLLCARDIYCNKGYLSTLFEAIERYQKRKSSLNRT